MTERSLAYFFKVTRVPMESGMDGNSLFPRSKSSILCNEKTSTGMADLKRIRKIETKITQFVISQIELSQICQIGELRRNSFDSQDVLTKIQNF